METAAHPCWSFKLVQSFHYKKTGDRLLNHHFFRPPATPRVTINLMATLVTAIYLAWIFWQRYRPSPAPIASDPMAAYGKSVRIIQFYTPTREIAPGEKAILCYSVVNATTVRLDPPVERLWPAISRCFEVTPATTTRYTLTAEGADHATVSQSIQIATRPPALK